MSVELKFITCNVRGLGEQGKCGAIYNYLHSHRYDIIFLQETHSGKDTIRRWMNEWGDRMWTSHGTTNAGGVALLLSKKYNFKVKNTTELVKGRALAIKLHVGNKTILLVNIYVPNRDDPSFYHNVFKHIRKTNVDLMTVAGDLNLVLDRGVDS